MTILLICLGSALSAIRTQGIELFHLGHFLLYSSLFGLDSLLFFLVFELDVLEIVHIGCLLGIDMIVDAGLVLLLIGLELQIRDALAYQLLLFSQSLLIPAETFFKDSLPAGCNRLGQLLMLLH